MTSTQGLIVILVITIVVTLLVQNLNRYLDWRERKLDARRRNQAHRVRR